MKKNYKKKTLNYRKKICLVHKINVSFLYNMSITNIAQVTISGLLGKLKSN